MGYVDTATLDSSFEPFCPLRHVKSSPWLLYCAYQEVEDYQRNSQASPSDQTIDPATYVSQDLYGILGVASNATNSEIKKQYLKIVAKTHPDRNSTPEALSVFRNATMAYTTLKDPTLRAKFDQKVKTKAAIDTLESTVVSVVDTTKPLVQEATKRFVDEYLTPLSFSAVEISSAAVEATKAANLEEIAKSPDSISLENISEKWRVAGQAFNEARLKKRYATTLSSIQRALVAEQNIRKRIRSNFDVLLRLNESITNIVEEEATCESELADIDQILKSKTSRLHASTLALNSTRTLTKSSMVALASLTASLKENTANITSNKEEQATLEARLVTLRRDEVHLAAEKERFLQEMAFKSAMIEEQQYALASCLDDVSLLESAVSVATEAHTEACARFMDAKKEREGREHARMSQIKSGESLKGETKAAADEKGYTI